MTLPKSSGLTDLALLEAIRKGQFDLKMRKLRALGFIKGKLPRIEVTPDGIQYIEDLISLLVT